VLFAQDLLSVSDGPQGFSVTAALAFAGFRNSDEKTRNRSRLPGRELDIGMTLNRKRGSAKNGLAADRKWCLQLIMDGLYCIAK
jgi:hypothetical protein